MSEPLHAAHTWTLQTWDASSTIIKSRNALKSDWMIEISNSWNIQTLNNWILSTFQNVSFFKPMESLKLMIKRNWSICTIQFWVIYILTQCTRKFVDTWKKIVFILTSTFFLLMLLMKSKDEWVLYV